MKQPCEDFVKKHLPFLRASLVVELARFGLTQKAIASSLGITQPAVSQYLRGIRAKNTIKDTKLKKEIEETSKKIMKTNFLSREDMCKLCKLLRSKGPESPC